MGILRLAVIGIFCICYVACQDEDLTTAWILKVVESENQNTTTTNVECTTDNGKAGICVKKAKCNNPDKTVIDPTTTFTLRERDCHYLQVCCTPEKVLNSSVKVPKYVPPSICGISNPGALVFREKDEANYNFADFADFPWMVALLKRNKDGQWSSSDYIGGGSIIHPSVVITAAHKVDKYETNEVKCRAGEWDTQTEKEVLPFQERNVNKIAIHDEYLRLHAHNDVALVILEKPFELAPHIGIACLGKLMPQPDTKCYSMGWGADFKNNKKYAVILKKIKLPLVGDAQCENNLKKTKLGPTYKLHNSMTCAGGEEGVDTCDGDGGSPLVCPIDNPDKDSARYAVFGMVAYGIECGVKDVPGVYVSVPKMYQWVVQRMETEGFPISQFEY